MKTVHKVAHEWIFYHHFSAYEWRSLSNRAKPVSGGITLFSLRLFGITLFGLQVILGWWAAEVDEFDIGFTVTFLGWSWEATWQWEGQRPTPDEAVQP